MKKAAAVVALFLFVCAAGVPSGFSSDELLKIQVFPDQNSVKPGMMFLVRVQVINSSDEATGFWSNTCSYEKHWVTDNPQVFIQSWTCDENDLEQITLETDGVYEKNIILYIPTKDKSGDVTFRLGFKRMSENGDVAEPLWSDPITMGVRVPEEAAAPVAPAASEEVSVSEPSAKEPAPASVPAPEIPAVPGSPRIYQDPAVPIQARIGEEFMIVLQGNATTGYGWQLRFPDEEKTIALVESKYIPSDTRRVGAPGDQEYRFRALKTGEVKIDLAYRRPWEPNDPLVRKVFTVVVLEK
ncbi:MAG TPA: protease inhibitor I42 family protein [Candidatus Omnitrophota bacterium]|nr:protease inhibitor I42 family protein [Candidatus Omnitrophota bacterium]HPS36935.1 protease inhibitor I42 family protein [Candidatus Omnitrophota bacterium]